MPGISLQELAFAYRAGERCEIWAVECATESRPVWTVEVVLFDDKKSFSLQGQRGAQRTWRDFDRVASVLKETCPGLTEIKVKFANSPNNGGQQKVSENEQ
ncbi:hypothetical protein B7760_05780 (plasmid) [Burkholderia glumae]|nr:hypothetical protein KS03_5713 [Burkholderia glumae LMG 2196 = ATCC 33617]QKM51703.1 hypothetical protein B7760_05780 [Burkholderia glumae]QTP37355.1 hypothetical protein B7759_05998 [Burkholderia glumae]